MNIINLTDNWLMACGRDVGVCDPSRADYDPKGWLRARVPSTVQENLVAHGVVPSPWKDRQAEALRAFENDPWWFRCELTIPADARDAECYEIVAEGVSFLGTVRLNGHAVGFTHNALRPHRFDITPFVRRTGTNILAVECRLALEEMSKRVRLDVSKNAEEIRPYMRICQMFMGWDFAPRLTAVGLWRPVRLVCHRRLSIEDICVHTESLEDDRARLRIAAQLRSFAAAAEAAQLHLAIHENPDDAPVWSHTVDVGGGPLELRVELPNPRLWYPHPMGDPFRYTLKARLECDGVEVDRHTTRFGVRTVELKQDDQFTFCVNGIDVFAKGANWVPSNSLTWDAAPEHYRHLVELAHEAHFNMFRVWGGGIYEPEVFYDLCDELGIMIWQDFMYACAMYPDDDPAFMESAETEARDALKRLRRHPSVVLWCGNNECQEAWVLGDWPARAPRHLGERLYDDVLPDVVRQLSPGTPYWPGSPYGGPTTRSRTVGDFHDWYSLPNWPTYDANAPRFSSEYGFRSVPQRETVDAMISPEFQWDRHGPQNNVWDYHHGACGWMRDVMPQFGDPQTLDEYIMISQEVQATLMRYAIEVYRRRMFATSGSLIWQYDEPWPAVTFSLVDFFGRAKAAYYWVRRAYAPVLGLFYGDDPQRSFWGVSELPEKRPCTVRIRRFNHAGALLSEEAVEGSLEPNGATKIIPMLPESLRLTRPEEQFLQAELHCGDVISERTYHAAPRKDWRLPHMDMTGACERVGANTLRVAVSAPGYVHFVGVTVEDPSARFSDNFFDLLPNEPRTVTIRTNTPGDVTIRAANADTIRLPVA